MKNIPKKFKLFSTTIDVLWDDERAYRENFYGLSEYSLNRITLSIKEGQNNLSEDRIIDTFYHEKVHAILDAMNERDLSGNEKFVDVFAKLLRQSDDTSEY